VKEVSGGGVGSPGGLEGGREADDSAADRCGCGGCADGYGQRYRRWAVDSLRRTYAQASRFRRAHEVEAYLGLAPRELSSGKTQRRGRITKAGSSRVRWLLIQAAVSMLRLRDPRTAALREWAGRIAARRGKGIAVVALARRLAGILFALLRDGTVYESRRCHAADVTHTVPV